jgi:hypothetical protein
LPAAASAGPPRSTSPTAPADRFTYKAGKEGKESKEHKDHKDKDKDGKEQHKELKDLKEKDKEGKEGKEGKAEGKEGKESKEGKEHKDKEIEAPPPIGIHPPVPVDPIANASDAGAVGRAFVAPADRPQVGVKALRDETDNP